MAVVATAHKLARILYAMIAHAKPFEDLGVAGWEATRRDRILRNLTRQAKNLGLQLVPLQPAAVSC